MRTIDASDLHGIVAGARHGEYAVVDVRDVLDFTSEHLFAASSVPLDRLESLIGDLLPRPGVPVVVVDGGDGAGTVAAERLHAFGFSDVATLTGGIAAWKSQGLPVYAGMNVPSKALGAAVRERLHTPSISVEALSSLMGTGEDVIVIDCRTPAEYERNSIPWAVSCSGDAVPVHLDAIAPEPETTVVIACAGRTRSVLTTQSLVESGFARAVYALDGGTMAWHLAGLPLEPGSRPTTTAVGIGGNDAAVQALAVRAAATMARFVIPTVSPAVVDEWVSDVDTTTYLLDVRSPIDFQRGHIAGSRSAPGTQLLLATDAYIGAHGARVVLVDDPHSLRATIAARWLRAMRIDAHVLEGGTGAYRLVGGDAAPTLLGHPHSGSVGAMDARRLIDGGWEVIDVSISASYSEGHIPGSRWLGRRMISTLDPRAPGYLVVSDDDHLARIVADEIADATLVPTATLRGGVTAWRGSGYPMAAGLEGPDRVPRDRWTRPSEAPDDVERAMREYLQWGDGLLDKVLEDPLVPWVREIGAPTPVAR